LVRTLLFFVSVLIHELSHAAVGNRLGQADSGRLLVLEQGKLAGFITRTGLTRPACLREALRPEVPAAVAQGQSAGIKLKLITGDHALTAQAVAGAAGIAHDDALIVTAAELARLLPAQAAQLARKASIFASSAIAPAPSTKRHFKGIKAS